MRLSYTICLLLAGMTTGGCGQRVEPGVSQKSPQPPQSTSEKPTEIDLGVLRYHTGDVENWPNYDFPLEHSFDVPEVPAKVIGPFSAEDLLPADE